jgi:hypothetical protein
MANEIFIHHKTPLMKLLHILFAFLMLSFVLVSCNKDDVGPVITITSPAEGSTLEKGKTYPVTGTITDDGELASIKSGSVVITTFDSPTSHTLKDITLTIPTTTTFTDGSLEIVATDKAGNETVKTVTFKIK